jgi:hypothetical protein
MKPMSFSLQNDVHEALQNLSSKRGLSMAAIIRDILYTQLIEKQSQTLSTPNQETSN